MSRYQERIRRGKYRSSGRPGEVEAVLHKHVGKDIERDFPDLASAEKWVRKEIKKDVGREHLWFFQMYVYEDGWYTYKYLSGGTWIKSSPEDVTPFLVWG